MKIIITGSEGQLGKTFRDLFSEKEAIEVGFIDLNEVDLCDERAVLEFFRNNECDIVINCAGYTAVDQAETDYANAMAGNVKLVENLAKAALENDFRIVHFSTDYVFDGEGKRPYKENNNTAPATVYGLSKLRGEQLLLKMLPDAIVIRTSWLYSGYGKNFFLTMKRKALSGEEVRVVNDQWGTPTNAADLASAVLNIIESARWTPGVYHYSNEGCITWYDFARKIYKGLGAVTELVKPIATEDYPSKAVRPKYSVLDKTKIKDTFSLEVPYWEVSLDNLLKDGFD